MRQDSQSVADIRSQQQRLNDLMENKFKRRQEIIESLKAEKRAAEARPTIHIHQGNIHIHSKLINVPLQESTQQRPRQNTMLVTRTKTFAWKNAEQEKQYQQVSGNVIEISSSDKTFQDVQLTPKNADYTSNVEVFNVRKILSPKSSSQNKGGNKLRPNSSREQPMEQTQFRQNPTLPRIFSGRERSSAGKTEIQNEIDQSE